MMHLFLFFVTLSMEVAASFFSDLIEIPPMHIVLFSPVPLMYIFRRFGNFNLSGNLLSLVVAALLFQSVFETGGLYSDNLLWMMTVPLLSLLFANRISGFLWLVGLSVFTFYLHGLANDAPGVFVEQIAKTNSDYYVVSYVGLYAIVVGIVLVFATGQAMIIKSLDESKKVLTQQKEELIRQAESLRLAEEQLLASNKELERFAYVASHDLKEPLRMIGMYTQLIKRKTDTNGDPATKEYMHFVTDGVDRMKKLLEDLLEYSRLGKSDQVQKADIDLNEILYLVVNNLTASIKDSGAEVLANELPLLSASSTEMMQLFQNLISNSIKFRREGVEPVISINHQIENTGHRFVISDNGIGISPEYQEKVFDVFERVHSRQDYEGTGIGLATCKKIVSTMGGRIWVEQNSLPGTTFVISLPEDKSIR